MPERTGRHSWRQSITSIILNDGEPSSSSSDAAPAPSSTGRDSNSDAHSGDAGSEANNDSTTALILETEDPALFLSFDEEDDDQDASSRSRSLVSAPLNVSASLPSGLASLPPYILQLFLISPSLLLGATLLQGAISDPGSGFSKTWMIMLSACAFAALGGLANQIWVLSGRYVRRWSIEDIVAHALFGASTRRDGPQELWRKRITLISRILLALLAGFLSFVYLHEAAALILRDAIDPNPLGHAVIVLVFSGCLSYFLIPTSMGARRMWIASGLTIVAHLADGIIMLVRKGRSIRDHPTARSPYPLEPDSFVTGVNWHGFTTLAFTFASPLLIYPLYISRLVPTPSASPTAPKTRRIPYPLHIIVCSLLSVGLLTPYLLILPSDATPNPILRSIALLSGIPPLWVLALVPRLPTPSSASGASIWRRIKYKYALWLLITLLSVLVPPRTSFMRGLERVLIFFVLFTTYFLPALLHLALHMLRAPLAILLVGAEDASPSSRGGNGGGGEELGAEADALLRKKERSLQRRRLGRRLVWDVLVWVVLLPCGIWMSGWAFGRIWGWF